MKKTTPTYGEEHTGKPYFKVELATAPIGRVIPGNNVVLADIYARVYQKFDNYEDKIKQLESLLKAVQAHPPKSYFDNWKFDSQRKITEPHLVIVAEDLKNLIEAKLKELKMRKADIALQIRLECRDDKKNAIMNELYSIEYLLDNREQGVNHLRKSKRILESIINQLTENFDQNECFETKWIFSKRTGDYLKKSILTAQVLEFARDLFDIIDEKLQSHGL